jgi:PKHD-type hydroxylase
MLNHVCWVFSGEGGLSEERCDWLVERGLNTPEQVATHSTSDGTFSKDDNTRSSRISWLHGEDYYSIIRPFMHKANDNAGWKYDIRTIENIQFTKYGVNQHYEWHIDGNCDHNAARLYVDNPDGEQLSMTQTSDPALVGMCRKLSVSVQLSHGTDYEGGDMEFTDLPLDQSHKELNIWTNKEFRKKGTVIVFPSFIRHRVTPVTEGTRYSAVAWINGPPLR